MLESEMIIYCLFIVFMKLSVEHVLSKGRYNRENFILIAACLDVK